MRVFKKQVDFLLKKIMWTGRGDGFIFIGNLQYIYFNMVPNHV